MPGKLLDTEIVSRVPIPKDIGATGIVGEETNLYNPYAARDRRSGKPLDNNEALIRILKNSDIDILLRTIGNAFFPRVITVGTSPTLLIRPNRFPRGYIIINPGVSVSGVVSNVTVFPIGTVFPVGSTVSAAINVSAHGGAAFFMNLTEASAGPVTVDLETQDSVSGNWAVAQSDIFSGASALGTFYANVGQVGIDGFARLRVTVAGDSMTGNITASLKPALGASVAGPAIYLGNEDVNTTIGFPLLSGQDRTFYLKENTPLYAVAVAASTINLFELQ